MATELRHYRVPGIAQGWVLVMAGWLSAIVGILVSPILPRMSMVFQADRSVDVKISLVATVPALAVAVLGLPMGWLADKIGYKRVLVWACALYGVVGTAPLWLQSLDAIVVSRFFVGVAEAAVMTCSGSLLGSYFTGRARQRWFAAQTGTPPIVSTVMLAAGGALGEANWRTPFMVYVFGFVIFALTLLFIWEPVHAPHASTEAAAPSASPRGWTKLLGISAITVFAMSAFLVTVIQFGFLLTARGLISPRLIGAWSAVASVASVAGALLFAFSRWRIPQKLFFSFSLLASGFSVMALSSSYQPVIVGAIVANLGSGFLLPALITWALSDLSPQQRGRGTGLWMAASFFGQFLSPLSIVYLADVTGSRDHAVLVYAIVCAACAAMALLSLRNSQPQRHVGGTA